MARVVARLASGARLRLRLAVALESHRASCRSRSLAHRGGAVAFGSARSSPASPQGARRRWWLHRGSLAHRGGAVAFGSARSSPASPPGARRRWWLHRGSLAHRGGAVAFGSVRSSPASPQGARRCWWLRRGSLAPRLGGRRLRLGPIVSSIAMGRTAALVTASRVACGSGWGRRLGSPRSVSVLSSPCGIFGIAAFPRTLLSPWRPSNSPTCGV
jgi:hypothetical protein